MPLRRKKRYLTAREVAEIFETDSEGIDNIVILPPDNCGDITDEEEEQCENGTPNDVPGELEIERHLEDDDINNEDDAPVCGSSGDGPPRAKKKTYARSRPTSEIKWEHAREEFDFSKERSKPREISEELPHLLESSPFQMFRYFLNDKLISHLVIETNRYASQQNMHTQPVTEDEIYRFIRILLLSGYHRLPEQHHYWSSDEDIGVRLVSNSMPRHRFTTIKRRLHLTNNEDLRKEDRAAKVRPYLSLINESLIQFGVFKKDLSADEQMCLYYGKHSARMFMHNKPIKFGYKFWVLASSCGYPFRLEFYVGKEEERIGLLGHHVIQKLVNVLSNPECHTLTFDNFFSSYDMLLELKQQGIAATGTVRPNRLRACPLPSPKDAKHLPRGEVSFAGDGNVVSCCWIDNKPVYVISNFIGVTPMESKRRFSQSEKKAHSSQMSGYDL